MTKVPPVNCVGSDDGREEHCGKKIERLIRDKRRRDKRQNEMLTAHSITQHKDKLKNKCRLLGIGSDYKEPPANYIESDIEREEHSGKVKGSIRNKKRRDRRKMKWMLLVRFDKRRTQLIKKCK